jgi:hypothetical protein
MAASGKRKFPITPSECLDRLPEPSLESAEEDARDDLRRAELRRSVLAIAELNHVSETAMVRSAVSNALGRLPRLDE